MSLLTAWILIATLSYLFSMLLVQSSDLNYRVEHKKIVCVGSEHFYSNVTCKLNQLKGGRQSYFAYAELKPNKTINHLWTRLSVFHRDNPQAKYRPYIGLANATMNMCMFLDKKDKNPILSMALVGLDKKGNVLQSCPIRENRYLIDYVPIESNYIRIVSMGEYLVHIYFFSKKPKDESESFVADIKITVNVKPKRIR